MANAILAPGQGTRSAGSNHGNIVAAASSKSRYAYGSPAGTKNPQAVLVYRTSAWNPRLCPVLDHILESTAIVIPGHSFGRSLISGKRLGVLTML